MYKKSILFVLFALISTFTYASFPVNKANLDKSSDNLQTVELNTAEGVSTVEIPNLTVEASEAISPAAAQGGSDNMIMLLLLWFFLGGLAAHRWYAGKSAGMNILFILTLGGLGIWAIVDLVKILGGDFME